MRLTATLHASTQGRQRYRRQCDGWEMGETEDLLLYTNNDDDYQRLCTVSRTANENKNTESTDCYLLSFISFSLFLFSSICHSQSALSFIIPNNRPRSVMFSGWAVMRIHRILCYYFFLLLFCKTLFCCSWIPNQCCRSCFGASQSLCSFTEKRKMVHCARRCREILQWSTIMAWFLL